METIEQRKGGKLFWMTKNKTRLGLKKGEAPKTEARKGKEESWPGRNEKDA